MINREIVRVRGVIRPTKYGYKLRLWINYRTVLTIFSETYHYKTPQEAQEKVFEIPDKNHRYELLDKSTKIRKRKMIIKVRWIKYDSEESRIKYSSDLFEENEKE